MRNAMFHLSQLVLYFVLATVGIGFDNKPAHAQDTEPTIEELQAQIDQLSGQLHQAQVDQVPNKVAQKTNVNSPRRHHVYVDACGVEILNQPANGRHTERMMAQNAECLRIANEKTEIDNRGTQGLALANALSTAINTTSGAANIYANTHEGKFASGEAAGYAAMADGDNAAGLIPGDAFGWAASRVNALASVQALQMQGQQPVPVATTSSTRPPKIAPEPAPTREERAKADIAAALE